MKEEIWQWVKTRPWIVAGIGGIVIVLLSGWWVVSQLRPPTPATPMRIASSKVNQTTSTSRAQTAFKATVGSGQTKASVGPLYVDVKGAVNKPGVYQVQATMRVADVIALAQGMQPQADQQQVNLAAKVTDQQVIYVPVKGAPPVPPVGQSTSAATPGTAASSTGPKTPTGPSSTSTGPINLNSADVTALQKIKGIGAKKAQKIIDYRQQHGPFKSMDDLKQISGFGAKTIAKFKDQLTV